MWLFYYDLYQLYNNRMTALKQVQQKLDIRTFMVSVFIAPQSYWSKWHQQTG